MILDKLEIGDVIIGTKKANDYYRITREGWIGIIKGIDDCGAIEVEGKDEYGNIGIFPVDIRFFDILGNFTAPKLAYQLGFFEKGGVK